MVCFSEALAALGTRLSIGGPLDGVHR
jgi:hypothetical protein